MSQVNFSKKKIRFICVGRPALLIFDAVQRKTETLWKSQKLVDSKGVNFWFVGELIVKEGEDLTLVMLDITPDLLEEEHKAAIVSSIADEHWRTWNDIPTNTKLSLIYERFCPRGRFVSGELTGKDAYSLFQDYKTLCEQWLENRCSTEDPAPDAAVLGGQPSVPTGSAILGTASQCYHPDHIQFCRDMAEAGIATQIDGMRFFWHGPTATCTDISQIMSKTQIPCIWDERGKEFVVYPKVYGEKDLVKAIARFHDDDFKSDLVHHLMQGHPLKAIAQNVIDQLAPYFTEEIKQG